jgi:hypothetical protein
VDPDDEDAEDGAAADVDAQRKGKCVVLKTSTRQTVFLPASPPTLSCSWDSWVKVRVCARGDALKRVFLLVSPPTLSCFRGSWWNVGM